MFGGLNVHFCVCSFLVINLYRGCMGRVFWTKGGIVSRGGGGVVISSY